GTGEQTDDQHPPPSRLDVSNQRQRDDASGGEGSRHPSAGVDDRLDVVVDVERPYGPSSRIQEQRRVIPISLVVENLFTFALLIGVIVNGLDIVQRVDPQEASEQ